MPCWLAAARPDAGLKIAVTGQDGGGDERLVCDGLRHGPVDLPRVADARHAAVAHRVEAEAVGLGRGWRPPLAEQPIFFQ